MFKVTGVRELRAAVNLGLRFGFELLHKDYVAFEFVVH